MTSRPAVQSTHDSAHVLRFGRRSSLASNRALLPVRSSHGVGDGPISLLNDWQVAIGGDAPWLAEPASWYFIDAVPSVAEPLATYGAVLVTTDDEMAAATDVREELQRSLDQVLRVARKSFSDGTMVESVEVASSPSFAGEYLRLRLAVSGVSEAAYDSGRAQFDAAVEGLPEWVDLDRIVVVLSYERTAS